MEAKTRNAVRELPNLSLDDVLQLVHLYANRESPKYEKAALRWLERYLTEGAPRLQHFAEVALASRETKRRVSMLRHGSYNVRGPLPTLLGRVKRVGVDPDGLGSALREHTPLNRQGWSMDVPLSLCELDALEIDVLALDKAGSQESREVEVGELRSELVDVLAIPSDEREHLLILVHHS